MPALSTAHLFGIPWLQTQDGVRVAFTHERSHQLIALLACRRDWVHRDEMAEWFWPAQEASAARSNLRKVLLMATRVPGVVLEREGDRIRWSPDSDLAQFEAACDDARLDAAIHGYPAPLLDGMERAFEQGPRDWLDAERQRLDARWRQACERQLAKLTARPAEAVALAERMLARDALDEPAVLALANALLALGQAGKAATALAAYRRQLAGAFAAEPSAAVRALVLQAQMASAESVGQPATSPVQGFIGRKVELAAIDAALMRSGTRCLTLVGPGGIGKSSVCRAAAAGLVNRGARAMAWAPLSDLTESSQVPARLAAALGLATREAGDPWHQLEAAVGDKAVVLVIDNAEHLDLGARLSQLLARCNGLQLLATSRSRLAVVGEQVMTLDGLLLPDDDESDAEVLRLCDSVRLFELRASMASPRFDLASQAAAVVKLVHQVEGMPLALELAAAWTRVLTVDAIVGELAQSIDLLDASRPGERGLRASFEQSWRMAAPAERECLPRLALLPGEFTREMAQQVCSVTLAVLASLIDKSLLRTTADGWFSMHALIQSCALEHTIDRDAVLDAHLRHVADWLSRYRTVGTVIPAAIHARMDRELPHIRAAWSRSVARRDAAAILSMARPWSMALKEGALAFEGIEAMQAAIRALDAARPADLEALVSVMNAKAVLEFECGRLEDAEQSARRSIELGGNVIGIGPPLVALNLVALSLWQRGHYLEARSFFEQGSVHAIQAGETRSIAQFSANLAMVDKALGHYRQAMAGYHHALEIHREAGDLPSVGNMLNNIANVHRALQEPDRAIQLLNEALMLSRQHGLVSVRTNLLVNLGLAHGELGDDKAASGWFAEAARLTDEVGPPSLQAAILIGQAHLDARAGRFDSARARTWQALSVGDGFKSTLVKLRCAMAFGVILAHEGRLAEARALMRWSLAQDGWNRPDHELAERTLAGLPNPAESAEDPAWTLDPAAALADVLVRV
ncbi:hypothetical protein BH10PSE17_BH10PSE17_23720 [soil metagenome]